MPKCYCPKCEAVHNVAIKSLGKKGRCSQCQAVFVLREESAEVSPDPTPTVPSEPVFVVLREAEPPVPFDLSESLEAPAVVSDEERWMESLPGGLGDDSIRPGVVAPLVSRPVITAIASLLFGLGIVALILAVLAFGLAVRVASSQQQGAVLAALTMFAPLGGGLLILAVLLMGLSELLAIMRGIEVRQHEISRNCSR